MGDNVTSDNFLEEITLPKADEDLIRVYRDIGRSVDDLAYTSDFEKLYDLFKKAGHPGDKQQVFRRLLILRKSGLLPRLFRTTEGSAA